MEIFDAHQHVITGYRDDAEKWSHEYQTRVEVMHENGIHSAAALPSNAYNHPDGVKDTQRVNDAMAAYKARDPKRFPVVAGTVEPKHGERALEEVARVHHELKLDGLCWHHFLQGAYIDAPIMYLIIRKMVDLGLVPFVHIYAENPLEAPWRLERLALEFPSTTFVALDGFSSFEQGSQMIALAQRVPNVMFDTALLKVPDFLKQLVKTIGSHRVVLGTNQYSEPQLYKQSPRARWSDVLHLVQNAYISDEERADVLGGNMQRLFNLVSTSA